MELQKDSSKKNQSVLISNPLILRDSALLKTITFPEILDYREMTINLVTNLREESVATLKPPKVQYLPIEATKVEETKYEIAAKTEKFPLVEVKIENKTQVEVKAGVEAGARVAVEVAVEVEIEVNTEKEVEKEEELKESIAMVQALPGIVAIRIKQRIKYRAVVGVKAKPSEVAHAIKEINHQMVDLTIDLANIPVTDAEVTQVTALQHIPHLQDHHLRLLFLDLHPHQILHVSQA